MSFNQNDEANVVLPDGSEARVKIKGFPLNDIAIISVPGSREFISVPIDKLLPLKTPFFDVRGLVSTGSPRQIGNVGEIIAKGKNGRAELAFKVKITDGSEEWFNADEVFIEVSE